MYVDDGVIFAAADTWSQTVAYLQRNCVMVRSGPDQGPFFPNRTFTAKSIHKACNLKNFPNQNLPLLLFFPSPPTLSCTLYATNSLAICLSSFSAPWSRAKNMCT
jgi:hypothetical protein